jgi:hypothetical protein
MEFPRQEEDNMQVADLSAAKQKPMTFVMVLLLAVT